jgi:hypothetical protein
MGWKGLHQGQQHRGIKYSPAYIYNDECGSEFVEEYFLVIGEELRNKYYGDQKDQRKRRDQQGLAYPQRIGESAGAEIRMIAINPAINVPRFLSSSKTVCTSA